MFDIPCLGVQSVSHDIFIGKKLHSRVVNLEGSYELRYFDDFDNLSSLEAYRAENSQTKKSQILRISQLFLNPVLRFIITKKATLITWLIFLSLFLTPINHTFICQNIIHYLPSSKPKIYFCNRLINRTRCMHKISNTTLISHGHRIRIQNKIPSYSSNI